MFQQVQHLTQIIRKFLPTTLLTSTMDPAVVYIGHPCAVCYKSTSMWCSQCQNTWYCSPEHLRDVCYHTPGALLGTHPTLGLAPSSLGVRSHCICTIRHTFHGATCSNPVEYLICNGFSPNRSVYPTPALSSSVATSLTPTTSTRDMFPHPTLLQPHNYTLQNPAVSLHI